MVHIAIAEIQSHLSAFMTLTVQAIQIVARQLLERTGTGAMQNRYFTRTYHQRIVHLSNQSLQCLIGSIAAQV